MSLCSVSLDELTIDDEASVEHLPLYGRLKAAVRRSGHRFLVPAAGTRISWDRALFLNLTYWSGDASSDPESAGDTLCDRHLAADEIGHIGWHHVVGRELSRQGVGAGGPPSAAALFFSESIASAFDLYLLGRLLRDAPDSDFTTTQVPLMAERAEEAGLSSFKFERLLESVAADPERAFEDMRALLFDAANALFGCRGPVAAQAVLGGLVGRRFEPLLHHFELSNWILYARAFASGATDDVVARHDALLREAPSALAWLADHWLDGDLVA